MINLTTVKNSKRLTGELRQEAKDYIRKQFIQFKNKLGLFSNPDIKFVHKVGKTLNISETVVKSLCTEANINLDWGTMKDAATRQWINNKIDDGMCQASLIGELNSRGVLNTRGNTITYGCLNSYRRNYLGVDSGHATSGSPDFVNHMPRKKPNVMTGGLGVHDTKKVVEITTQRYNVHKGIIYKALDISETQVKRLFTKEQIEHSSPYYLVAKYRQKKAATKTKIKTRR